MTAKQKRDTKLLKESIAHWTRMRTDHTISETPFGTDCPLCSRYCKSSYGKCEGCPVEEATGQANCAGTPWRVASNAWFHALRRNDSAWRKAAQAEIDFLRSLLPRAQHAHKTPAMKPEGGKP